MMTNSSRHSIFCCGFEYKTDSVFLSPECSDEENVTSIPICSRSSTRRFVVRLYIKLFKRLKKKITISRVDIIDFYRAGSCAADRIMNNIFRRRIKGAVYISCRQGRGPLNRLGHQIGTKGFAFLLLHLAPRTRARTSFATPSIINIQTLSLSPTAVLECHHRRL